ncbi:MAG: metalloregulator ArsR/SmtB family transcription factor [Polyangiales bacterium]
MVAGPDEARPAPSPRWELYRLLGDAARLRLMALAAEEELAIGELAELLGEVQPSVSRHVAALRQAGVVGVRRQGTWTLVRLAAGAGDDPVVADALRTGRSLCERDGALGRVADVVRARESTTREFFARPGRSGAQAGPPGELAAYLAALAPLLPRRALAVDVGTGDGRLLEVLCPLYERVVAVDRSAAQLTIAAERVGLRGFANVDLVEGEIDGAAALKAVRHRSRAGADAVFAARVLHHAPRPGDAVKAVASMVRPGGALVVIEYERHEDEALRSQQADLWLGFEASELRRYAREAGLADVHVAKVPAVWCGAGPDRHVPWQVMTARAPEAAGAHDSESNPAPAATAARKHNGAKR